MGARRVKLHAVALGFAGLALAAGVASAEGFKPTRPVEIVVHTGSGGGSDVFARVLVQIGLFSVPSPGVMNNIFVATDVRAVCHVPFGTTT